MFHQQVEGRVEPGALAEFAAGRLNEILALLTAIDAGELFADAPQGLTARLRHETGSRLLSVLQREIFALLDDLETVAPGA